MEEGKDRGDAQAASADPAVDRLAADATPGGPARAGTIAPYPQDRAAHAANGGAWRDGARHPGAAAAAYAALDLGTNNCRLLIARPLPRGFKVVDAFSRIIRLGEGVAVSGELSQEAIERTIEALRICAAKMRRHRVTRARLIATEACRLARNAPEFLARVLEDTGLDIEIISREAEARLAVSGCASLIDTSSDLALVFDIGGGSSELIWLDLRGRRQDSNAPIDRLEMQDCISAWTSLPVGVVTLAESYGGRFVDESVFDAMVSKVTALLEPFEAKHRMRERMGHLGTHLLGTSGTVTTVAGVHLGLPRYDRKQVDGCWLEVAQARAVTATLLASTYAERVAQPCIGMERAEFVLAGCAILEALLRAWPCERLRVADRGLREGILATLMAEDGLHGAAGRSTPLDR